MRIEGIRPGRIPRRISPLTSHITPLNVRRPEKKGEILLIIASRNRSAVFALIFLLSFLIPLVIPVPSHAADFTSLPEVQQASNLINTARTNAGLKPLALDPTLTGLALIKAQETASNKYFGCLSSTSKSLPEMLKSAGVRYTCAGQNLIKAPAITPGLEALSGSKTSAVYNPNYDKMGIGIMSTGGGKILVIIYTGSGTGGQTQPQPQPQPQPAPVSGLNADEQKMLDLVNQERARAGLQPLTMDINLVKLARMKGQDMIDGGYFAHNSPTYGSPFDMMKKYGVNYRYAGENLAGAPTVESAHTNLMNSPGHRANILNANYTKVGIGMVSGGPYGKMFVQMFIG